MESTLLLLGRLLMMGWWWWFLLERFVGTMAWCCWDAVRFGFSKARAVRESVVLAFWEVGGELLFFRSHLSVECHRQ